MYIKRKEEEPKTVPSKYTKSMQKQPKDSTSRGKGEKHTTFPYLELNQSKKLTR